MAESVESTCKRYAGLTLLRRMTGILREEDGGSMIEFAITISTALTLVFVIMQLCLALYMYGHDQRDRA